MKTRDEVLTAVKGGRESRCLDGRDYSRLVDFLPYSEWKSIGFDVAEGKEPPKEPRPWTEDAIKAQLASDLAFAFEKALDKRGLSAGMMYEVVKMWMWVLDDELQYFTEYAQYGLPLLKAVAIKHGLPNPIGDHSGNEFQYSDGCYA